MVKIRDLLIDIKGFTKKYENLEASKGSVTMITGENGCGKTILLNSICGHVGLKEGMILLNNMESSNEAWKEFTGCFLGKDFLIPYITSREYFELNLLIANKINSENKVLIDKYSKILFFNDFKKKIKHLSLGNQKKVGIISTLITNPDLIIWDEPFANLDKKTTISLNELLIELSNSGKTILYTNHPNEETYYSQIYKI
ncbi:hypothetical protein A8C32_14555 [Flavivirga aquatica]|uniref:ABC transporter domain-containing protein n=1 Tax=Flavivirga aquatica TaxID=1849968 RepID=A0A1E5TCM0_9FLAO|nr:ATP-binding cassette domain-containing protein [Flavivirga aquatica]OEK09101.1 hypothetical protein A8C32_14555 [Flavivirga aquatica]